uniref:Uncharacterized protein n=2 Tax=Timema TaxID=61471 RepID=A0A7R9B1Q3_TIMSH|nr:unnamed protein product [Timema shepardi]CAD7570070.1 unnamed protein product [Timema californicum]
MVSGSVRKLEALSPRQRSRGQIARSRRQQQQQCELPESYKYLHQRSNAPATITSSYERWSAIGLTTVGQHYNKGN